MKKLLIVALLSAPILGFAQDKKPAADPNQKEGESKTLVYKPENIYADLVVTSVPNRGTTIRLDFGRDVVQNLEDNKDLIAELTMLKTMPFPSVVDALNYLSSKGWKHVTQYEVTSVTGNETRLVLEKRVSKPRPGEPGSTPQRPPQVTREPGVQPADGSKPTEGTKPRK